MKFEEALWQVFENSQKYLELKKKKNPMVKLTDRAEEFALRELEISVKAVENILKED